MMAHGQFLLKVEGLTVSFDGFKAVDNLSFYVEPNECRVIDRPQWRGQDNNRQYDHGHAACQWRNHPCGRYGHHPFTGP